VTTHLAPTGTRGREPMKNRCRTLWTLLAALLLCAGATRAQTRIGFVVDGDYRDWLGGSSHERLDAHGDVTPEQIADIDIITYGKGLGAFFRDTKDANAALDALGGHVSGVTEYWRFVFIMKFGGDPFSGSVESSVEVLFDMEPGSGLGEPALPWEGFRPDYRLEITGKDGTITQELLHRWDGSRWVTTAARDLTEVESAISGHYLEGSVLWSAIGNRKDAITGLDYFVYHWAIRATQGVASDTVPDTVPREDGVVTAIDRSSWGSVKAEQPAHQ
jgi:hypothetical protein